jgi:hypothetical protein
LHSDHLLPFIHLLYFTQVCSFCQKLILKKKNREMHIGLFFNPFYSYILLKFVLFAKNLSYIFLSQILFLFLHNYHLLPFILLMYFTQVCSFCQRIILKKKQRNAHWSFFYPFYSYILLEFVLFEKNWDERRIVLDYSWYIITFQALWTTLHISRNLFFI